MATVTETIAIPDTLYTECFIGGRWVPAGDGKTFPTINPATEKVIAEVAQGTAEDILSRRACIALLEAYLWSSYPGYVDASRKLEFVCYDLLDEYGRTAAESQRQYRAYTHACPLEDDGPIVAALAASRYAVGSSRFLEETERRLAARGRGRPQDADLDLPRAG